MSCCVGDHTLSAAVKAINEVGIKTEDHDESFVIVMSGIRNIASYIGYRQVSFTRLPLSGLFAFL